MMPMMMTTMMLMMRRRSRRGKGRQSWCFFCGILSIILPYAEPLRWKSFFNQPTPLFKLLRLAGACSRELKSSNWSCPNTAHGRKHYEKLRESQVRIARSSCSDMIGGHGSRRFSCQAMHFSVLLPSGVWLVSTKT